jgi:hypothetical protein
MIRNTALCVAAMRRFLQHRARLRRDNPSHGTAHTKGFARAAESEMRGGLLRAKYEGSG